MRKTLKAFYTTLLAAALFGVRMLLLGLMSFLRWAAASSSESLGDSGVATAEPTAGGGPSSGARFVN
jgi:hypothetical protein